MKTLMQITKEMQELDIKIDKTSREAIDARKDFKLKEALYKNEIAKSTMKLKAEHSDWRSPDISANALTECYTMQLECIVLESVYLSKKNEVHYLSEQKNTLENENWNLRAEVKKFFPQGQ